MRQLSTGRKNIELNCVALHCFRQNKTLCFCNISFWQHFILIFFFVNKPPNFANKQRTIHRNFQILKCIINIISILSMYR